MEYDIDDLTPEQIFLVRSECNEVDTAQLYTEMLNDVYGEVNVAGMTFSQGEVLKEMDPTAFRVGESDYVDSLIGDGQLVEINGEYYRKEDVEEALDNA